MEIKTIAKGTALAQKRPETAETFAPLLGLNRAEGKRDLTWGRAWIWLGTSAVALSGLFALWTLGLVQESFARLRYQHTLMRATEALLSDLRDAEVGQMGYLLTGESSYLGLYNTSRPALDNHLDTLRTLTSNNLRQREQVEKLGPLVQQNFRELEEAVQSGIYSGLEAARIAVSTARSPQSMESIRRILQEMEIHEQMALDQFTQTQRARLWVGLAVLIGSSGLAVCSLLISQIALTRNVSGRRKAEEELRASATLNRSILDSLPANIAVVDRDGTIRTVNEVWRRFTRENGNPSALLVSDGANYMDVCRRSARGGSTDAREALAGLEEVLAGKRYVFEMQYACPSDTQARWFRMIISRLTGGDGGAVIVHVDHTERRRAEDALRESRQELRALAGRLLLAQEEERKRISRELHDDLSQKVALLAFDTSSLVLASTPLSEETKKALCSLQKRIAELATDVRQIAHGLHPSILEDLGLPAALRELCEEFTARNRIQACFEHKAMPETLPVEIAACLYRLAQEALHNVQKHAQASLVRLSVSGRVEGIRLCVEDNGIGFGADSSGQGLGLVSMKERVRLVRGQFSIRSQPGLGTTISVVVPLQGSKSETLTSTVSG
jgi:signal transduction histidine kinase